MMTFDGDCDSRPILTLHLNLASVYVPDTGKRMIGKLAFSLLKTEITKCSTTINLKLTNQIFRFRDFEAKTHLISSFSS